MGTVREGMTLTCAPVSTKNCMPIVQSIIRNRRLNVAWAGSAGCLPRLARAFPDQVQGSTHLRALSPNRRWYQHRPEFSRADGWGLVALEWERDKWVRWSGPARGGATCNAEMRSRNHSTSVRNGQPRR